MNPIGLRVQKGEPLLYRFLSEATAAVRKFVLLHYLDWAD